MPDILAPEESFTANDFEIISNSPSYSGFFKIKKLEIKHRLFAGGWSKPFTRELFARGESAAAILYDQTQNCVVMIEQFRPGAIHEKSPWLLEIVAGMVEKDESPRDVITREAMEEAGCKIKKLIKICRYFPSPGGSSEVIHLFCGLVDSTGIGGIHGLADENEDIRVKIVGFNEAYKMISDGQICNAASIMALQWVKINQEGIS